MSTLRTRTLVWLCSFCLAVNLASAQTFLQNFDGITAFSTLSAEGRQSPPSSYTFGWTGGAFSNFVTGANALNGTTSIQSGALSNNASPANLTTPVLAFSPGTTIRFKARLNTTSSNPTLTVRITTPTSAPTSLADIIVITTGGATTQLGTITRTFTMTVPNSITYPGDYRIQFLARGSGGSSRLTLDDVELTPGVLPVKLVSFTGQPDAEGNTLLRWRTSLEQQNRGFEVERSADLQTWTYLGQRAGLGTSGQGAVYEFRDTSPLRLGYYRLKQLDEDGRYSYSKIISVAQPPGPHTAQLRPDALGAGFYIDLDATEVRFPLLLTLVGPAGQVVLNRYVEQPTNQLFIERTGLGLSPILFLRLTDAAAQPLLVRRVVLTN
jgi:hypothetical protein